MNRRLVLYFLALLGLIIPGCYNFDKVWPRQLQPALLNSTKCPSKEISDLYKLGYGKTETGRKCRITYKNGMKSVGKLSEAVAYLDAFVIRQMEWEGTSSETECFFQIDTMEYKLVSHTRTHSINVIESRLHFKYGACADCKDVYYTLRLTKYTANNYTIDVSQYSAYPWTNCKFELILTAIMAVIIFYIIVWPGSNESCDEAAEENISDWEEEDDQDDYFEEFVRDEQHNDKDETEPDTEEELFASGSADLKKEYGWMDNAPKKSTSEKYDNIAMTSTDCEKSALQAEDLDQGSVHIAFENMKNIPEIVARLLSQELLPDDQTNEEPLNEDDDFDSDGSWYEIIKE